MQPFFSFSNLIPYLIITMADHFTASLVLTVVFYKEKRL